MSLAIKERLQSKPDVELYKHLSEKERMLAGFPHDEFCEELRIERQHARRILKELNSIEDEENKRKAELIGELFSPVCRGRKIIVEPTLHVHYGINIDIGNNVYIGFDCLLMDCAAITIGDNCVLGPAVHIYTALHPTNPNFRKRNDDYFELSFPVKIGKNCHIGGRSVFCPGAVVGDNVILEPGSVVCKDIPPNCIAGGNPAKVIRMI